MTILVLGSQLYSNTHHTNKILIHTVSHIIKVTLRTALDKMKTTLQCTPSALIEKWFDTDTYIYIYIYTHTPHPQFQNVDTPKSDGSSHSLLHKHTMSKHWSLSTVMSCDLVSQSLFRSNCQQSYKDRQNESKTTCEYIILLTRRSSLQISKHQI